MQPRERIPDTGHLSSTTDRYEDIAAGPGNSRGLGVPRSVSVEGRVGRGRIRYNFILFIIFLLYIFVKDYIKGVESKK